MYYVIGRGEGTSISVVDLAVVLRCDWRRFFGRLSDNAQFLGRQGMPCGVGRLQSLHQRLQPSDLADKKKKKVTTINGNSGGGVP